MATKQQDLKSPTPQPLTAHRPSTKLKPPPPTSCSKMVGPAQLLVYRLRVLPAYLPSPELEVLRQLRGLFSPPRASQLLAETHQLPPPQLATAPAPDGPGPRDLTASFRFQSTKKHPLIRHRSWLTPSRPNNKRKREKKTPPSPRKKRKRTPRPPS